MKTRLGFVVFAMTAVLAGCTEAVPEYCDENKTCPEGQFCNFERNACEPKQDGAIDAGQDVASDVVTEVSTTDLLHEGTALPDTMPIDTVKPDIWGPPKCGDKVKNGTEKCDNKDLGGASCTSLGFDGGGLVCSPDCKTIITTGCYKCGDKVKNGSEECDDKDFGAASCQSEGFECGDLTCSSQCKISTATCNKGWATKIPATVEAIASDTSGNVYITGIFSGTVTFGTTTLSGSNLYIAKLDNKGQFVWAKAPAGYVQDVRTIAVDTSGNTYIAGNYSSTVSFGLTTMIFQGSCGNESYVAKLDSSGGFKWATYIGGPNSSCEDANALAVGTSGLFLVGSFSQEADFGSINKKAISSTSGRDVFVGKMNPTTGDFVWVSVGGGDGTNDYGTDVAVDTAGNAYVAGDFWGSSYVDFGSLHILPTATSGNIFAVKLNAGGTFVWATPLGGTSKAEDKAAIAVDTSGNSYVVGAFKGTTDFGTTQLTSKSNSNDAYVAKLNPNGQVLWAVPSGGSGHDAAEEVAYVGPGNLAVVGYFDTAGSFGLHNLSGTAANPFLAYSSTGAGSTTFAIAGMWETELLSNGGYNPGAIAVDDKGQVLVGGSFSGSQKFGSTTLSGGGGFVWSSVCYFPFP